MAVSEVKRPSSNRFGSETVTNLKRLYLCNGHSPTDAGVRSGDGHVTAVAAGQSLWFYSGVGIFNRNYISSPHQLLRFPVVHLELRGLIYQPP